MLVVFIATLVVIINAAAFVLFMLDKHCARERLRRVPESTLLLVALFGGLGGRNRWSATLATQDIQRTFSNDAILYRCDSRFASVLAVSTMDNRLRVQAACGGTHLSPSSKGGMRFAML
jgi:hypothetical protein